MSIEVGQYTSNEFQLAKNTINLSFLSGAAGAVPAGLPGSIAGWYKFAGVTSVTRNSTGNYSAVLDSYWADYLTGGGSIRQQPGTYNAALAFDVKVASWTPATKTLVFVTTRPDTGVVIDMASGDILDAKFVMQAEVPLTPGAPVQ